MDREALANELRVIIEGYIASQGLDLVEFTYRYEGRDLVLRVLVDEPEGGISIAQCTELNKQINGIIEEKDLLGEGYILEVSSPGLDRSLKTKNDFSLCINKKVVIFLNEPINSKLEIAGLITGVDSEAVSIDTGRHATKIPLVKIRKAKQIIEKK